MPIPYIERLLTAYEDRPNKVQQVKDAIDLLNNAIEKGEIRKVEVDGLKHTLGYAIDKAWEPIEKVMWDINNKNRENHISDPPREKFFGQSYIYMSSINDVKTLKNKLDKTSIDHEDIKMMREFVKDLYPLYEALDSFKKNNQIIKGRAKREEPVQVNPNKDVKTCPCCFRGIAVRHNRMVLHGYERPGDGYVVGNCMGIQFPPLEVSTEGLEYLIQLTQNWIKNYNNSLLKAPEIKEITRREKNRKTGKTEYITYNQDDKRWKSVFDEYVRELEFKISQGESDLKYYNKTLHQWQEYHKAKTEKVEEAPEETSSFKM